MRPRFAYFYFMSGDPGRVRATAPRHVAHWRGLGLNDYLGGPFEDRTSGLIVGPSDSSFWVLRERVVPCRRSGGGIAVPACRWQIPEVVSGFRYSPRQLRAGFVIAEAEVPRGAGSGA